MNWNVFKKTLYNSWMIGLFSIIPFVLSYLTIFQPIDVYLQNVSAGIFGGWIAGVFLNSLK